MGRHCDKCRREYEGGSFYSGHDYCTTCYVMIKTEDDKRKSDQQRKQEEEARRQREKAAQKLAGDLLKRRVEEAREAQALSKREEERLLLRKEQEKEKKQAVEERKKLAMLLAKKSQAPAQTELPAPELRKKQVSSQQEAPKESQTISFGTVSKAGQAKKSASSVSLDNDNSRKRVAEYLALQLRQEQLALDSAEKDKKNREYLQKLNDELAEEKKQANEKYEKQLAELSKQADSLGAAEIERQKELILSQKKDELSKMDSWYSEKNKSEAQKNTEIKNKAASEIAKIEKKKQSIEAEINIQISAKSGSKNNSAQVEKDLIEEIKRNASSAARKLLDESGKKTNKETSENFKPKDEDKAPISDDLKNEMSKQALLDFKDILGVKKTQELAKKDLEDIYLAILGNQTAEKSGKKSGSKNEHDYASAEETSQCPQCDSLVHKGDKCCETCGKPFEPITELHLEVQKGLPVSLSQGQKENSCILVGTNPGIKPMACSLSAILLDSKKKSIEFEAEPGNADIPPMAKVTFEIKFDLKDETPVGPLILSANLKHLAGSSNPVSSITNVKTPMNLVYLPQSAALGGKLDNFISLKFENKGDSGGMIMLSSQIVFNDEKNFKKTGKLAEIVKIKGLEKEVLFMFGPLAMDQKFSKLVFFLTGVDSNGKPYRKEGAIKD